jgi:hypothetical protein
MSEEDYFLLCLAEEMSELSKELFKALRFGMDDVHPHTLEVNRARIAAETHDVRALLSICEKAGLLPPQDLEKESAKCCKVSRYLYVSKQLGKVQ